MYEEKSGSSRQTRVIREQVTQFFDENRWLRIPRAVDVVDLLERIAWQGVRLPSHLVMLRKVLFTLDGILHDIAGPSASMEFVMVQCLLQKWLENPTYVGWPLSLRDWVDGVLERHALPQPFGDSRPATGVRLRAKLCRRQLANGIQHVVWFHLVPRVSGLWRQCSRCNRPGDAGNKLLVTRYAVSSFSRERSGGDGITPKAIWPIVKAAAKRADIKNLAPHDLRRTCSVMPPSGRRT